MVTGGWFSELRTIKIGVTKFLEMLFVSGDIEPTGREWMGDVTDRSSLLLHGQSVHANWNLVLNTPYRIGFTAAFAKYMMMTTSLTILVKCWSSWKDVMRLIVKAGSVRKTWASTSNITMTVARATLLRPRDTPPIG